ncbi:MAG: hypothetical protein M3313_03860 [Actinomycetota bacterium]|nr:hypothetical protein [Actinomycetota bacterium]
MNSSNAPRHAAADDTGDYYEAADDYYDTPDYSDASDRSGRTGAARGAVSSRGSERGTIGGALLWAAWVIGLAILWYLLGFASTLAPENLLGAPEGDALPLPLYPLGYGRLAVGALVAGTVVGLVGRRASRVWPAGLLAAALAWAVTRSDLAAYSQDPVYSDDRLMVFGTILLLVATVVGLGIGLAGASGWEQRLVAISVVAGIAAGHVVGIMADLQSALTGEPSTISGAEIIRWLTLAVLFALAVLIAALGRAPWLLLTVVASVVLPVVVTVLVYVGQLIRPGAGRDIDEQILAPIADLLSAVVSTPSTWWPPLAILAGGVLGLVVWQARRGRRADMPVLDPAHPVTTGDPGGRTPRRGDPDD